MSWKSCGRPRNMPVAMSMSHMPMPADRSASSRISSRSHSAESRQSEASRNRSVPCGTRECVGRRRHIVARRACPPGKAGARGVNPGAFRIVVLRQCVAIKELVQDRAPRRSKAGARAAAACPQLPCFRQNEVADRPRRRQLSAPMACDVSTVASRPGPRRGFGLLSPPAPRGFDRRTGPTAPKRRGTQHDG